MRAAHTHAHAPSRLSREAMNARRFRSCQSASGQNTQRRGPDGRVRVCCSFPSSCSCVTFAPFLSLSGLVTIASHSLLTTHERRRGSSVACCRERLAVWPAPRLSLLTITTLTSAVSAQRYPQPCFVQRLPQSAGLWRSSAVPQLGCLDRAAPLQVREVWSGTRHAGHASIPSASTCTASHRCTRSRLSSLRPGQSTDCEVRPRCPVAEGSTRMVQRAQRADDRPCHPCPPHPQSLLRSSHHKRAIATTGKRGTSCVRKPRSTCLSVLRHPRALRSRAAPIWTQSE